MKISKSYLKQVINEEYKKVLKEQTPRYQDNYVKMKASDFLKLTTDQETRDYLKKRYEIEGMDYYPSRAGDLYLLVNKYYKVKEHEGRNRAYANIKKNGPDAENIVLIRMEDSRYDDLVSIQGQLDPNVFVDVTRFKLINPDVKSQVSNFLDFGDEPVKFKALIYPPNPYMPQEKVKPGFEEFLQFIEDKYAPYASNYRKLNNIENFTGEERNEFYKNYIDQINQNFSITDSQGPLKLIHNGFRNIQLDRKPNPRDTITLEKK